MQDRLEIEREVLVDLCSTCEGMLETLGETDYNDRWVILSFLYERKLCAEQEISSLLSIPFYIIRETASWDEKLAFDFKDLQRKIISSVVDSCHAGLKLLESEFGQIVS